MKHKIVQRLVSLLMILALAVSLFATSALAAAVEVTEEAVKEKTGTGGSIVVTVYDTTPGSAGTGVQQTPGGDPVKGVGINALRVGSVVELTTTTAGTTDIQVAFGIDENRIDLLNLSKDNDAIAYKGTTYYFAPETVMKALGTANQETIESTLDAGGSGSTKMTTDEDGAATFSNLQYGLYLLAKSELPAEATTDLVPFLVSVPMYVNGDWQNTVYAYPKVRTEKLELTKNAQMGGQDVTYVNAGETIQYTISTTIPATENGQGSTQDFAQFQVVDTNTGKTLDIDTSTLKVSLSSQTPETLTEGTDYTVDYEDPQNGDDSVLTVSLTEDGLRKLNAALSLSQTFTITYNATVATDVNFSSSLTNTAVLTYKRGDANSAAAATAEATETLYTYGIDLTKTLSEGSIEANRISFGLYSDETCNDEILVGSISTPSNGYWRAATGDTTMYVGADGHLKIYGLAPGTYYLKELTTMDGYTLLANPIEIVITEPQRAGDEPTATVNGTTATVSNGVVSLTVENTKNTNGFTLPQTGGAGTLAAIAVGLGLLSCGVILLAVYRRKERR